MPATTQPYLLHLLASSSTIHALDAVKTVLDNGCHNVNEYEPNSGLTPLHVAAAWDNLPMIQLLVHYGANVDAQDSQQRTPIQLTVSKSRSRRFLKKLSGSRRPRDRKRIFRLIAYVFGKTHQEKRNSEAKDGTCYIIRRRSSPPPPYSRKVSLLSSLQDLRISQESPARLKTSEMEDKTPGHFSNTDKQLSRPSLASHFSERDSMEPTCSSAIISHSTGLYPRLPPVDDSIVVPRLGCSFGDRCTSTSDLDFVTASEGEKTVEMEKTNDDTGRESDYKPLEIPSDITKLTVVELRQKLLSYGVEVGPINGDNRRLYERKLATIEQQTHVIRARKTLKYSHALESLITAHEKGINVSEIGSLQDDQICHEFCLGSPVAREKNEAASFCYLLIDPSKIPVTQKCTFREFIGSIFYVGKGKRSRPLQHLCDATKVRVNGYQSSDKLGRILHLWDRGFGVISLHIFFNIFAAEAFIREGAMMEAIGRENLTNLKMGEFYGVAKSWTSKQKAEFGSRLLFKAYHIFKNERCRPLMENELGH